jgi:hypothetical protein
VKFVFLAVELQVFPCPFRVGCAKYVLCDLVEIVIKCIRGLYIGRILVIKNYFNGKEIRWKLKWKNLCVMNWCCH